MATHASMERENTLQRAVEVVNAGAMKANKAAKLFDVPRSTLYNRLAGALPRAKAQGKKQLLTPAQVRGIL
jgi:transposase